MSRFRNPDEDEVQQYIRKAQAGQAGQNPRDQALARSSNNPRAQRIGARNMEQRANDNLAMQEDAVKEQERVAKEQAQAAENAAKEQAQAAEAQRKVNVRTHSAAGGVVETDIQTGHREIARHDDGAPKFEAGPVGVPQIVGEARTAVQNDAGQVQTVPKSNIMLGGGGDGGVLGADGTTSQAVWGQQVRDDRGRVSLVQPDSKTDSKTGAITHERTNPTTGKKESVMMEEALAFDDVQVKGARMRFEPQFQPIKKELDEATAEMEKLPPPLQLKGSAWMRISPTTGKETLATPAEVEFDKKLRADAKARLERAKKAYEPLQGTHEQLTVQEKQIDLRKQEVAEERTALAAGLPTGFNHLAAAVAKQGGMIERTGADDVVNEIEQAAEQSDPAKLIDVPLTEVSESSKRALGGLADLDGVTAKSERENFNTIWRDGKWIGTIQKRTGEDVPALILRDGDTDDSFDAEIPKDIRSAVVAQAQKPGAMPVYVRDNTNRMGVKAESEWVATSMETLQPLFSDPENPLTDEQQAKLVKDMGLDFESVTQKVRSGEITLNTGEKLISWLYGGTLAADVDPNDPAALAEFEKKQQERANAMFDVAPEASAMDDAAFQKWMQDESARMDKEEQELTGDANRKAKGTPLERWKEATETVTGYGFSKQDEIRRDFLADWYMRNAGKPGVSRKEMLKLHAESVGKKHSTFSGENAMSKVNALGRVLRDDVAGSMVGLGLGVATTLASAEMALLGVDGAKKELSEGMRLRNRDFASWANVAARNIKAWSTPEGMKRNGAYNIAAMAFQRAIDDAVDNPRDPNYAALVDQAEKRVRAAALAMHELSRDEDWPVTEENLDPNKDAALGKALAMYKATADPRFMDLYKERMLQGNGRRQYSAELTAKIGEQKGGFWSSVNHAMYAGWQELGTEIAADAAALVSGGAAKTLQIGARGARGVATAGQVARVGRAARVGASIERGMEALAQINRIGTTTGTLQKPLTALQKATNIGVQVVKGGIGEGLEEVVAEVGAENPNLATAFGMGFIGAFGMAPAQIAAGAIARPGLADDVEQKKNASIAARYNEKMAATPGFVPITSEAAGMVRALTTPQSKQRFAALQQMMAEDTSSLSPVDQALRKARIEGELMNIALEEETHVAAAREIEQITDPTERLFASGIAKVASGNQALLTSNEIKAVQGAKTASGADYFASVVMPNGQVIEAVTAEGRAEMLGNHPAIGALIQTDESSLLLQAQSQGQNIQPQATNGQNTQGQPAAPAQGQVAAQQGTAAPSVQSATYTGATSDVELSAAGMLPPPPGSSMDERNAWVAREVQQKNSAPAQGQASPGAPFALQNQALAPALSVAERVKSAVEDRVPALRGKVTIQEPGYNSGGIVQDIANNGLILPLEDIQREIDTRGGDINAAAEIIEQLASKHEVIHIAQTAYVRTLWEQAGTPGDFLSFFKEFYSQNAPRLLTLEAEQIAAKIYGEQAWNAISDPGLKAAEFVRMLVEAKIDGNNQAFGELFRAIKDKSVIAKIIEAALQALRAMTLTPTVADHVTKIEDLYRELTTEQGQNSGQNEAGTPAAPAAASTPAASQSDNQADGNAKETSKTDTQGGVDVNETPQNATQGGLSIIRAGQDSRIVDAQGVLIAQGTEQEMEAKLAAIEASASSPLRIASEAVTDALAKFPKLAGKHKATLRDATDDILDRIAALPAGDRMSAAQSAVTDLVNEIADRVAAETGKDRMEVIEGFRQVAGKRQAAAAASVEAAIVGTSPAEIPEGTKETRDTPNSEMRIEVTQTAVELDQLVGSSDPRFPGAALQPRNRSGQASANQREEMVNNLRDKDGQYRRYVEGVTTDSGRLVIAPLFGADGTHMINEAGKPLFYVISGNGRRNALEEARNRKVDARYQREVREALSNDNVDVSGMTMPVPVSVFVPSTPQEAIDLAEYSNRDAQLSVSNVEQAYRDAASIEKGNLLKLWETDANGDPAAASNRDFVKAFVRATGDEGIVDSKGQLTDEGAQRIERAMVAMLMGPKEMQLAELLFNRSSTLGLRSILAGVASEAGNLLKLAASKPDFDITPALANALRTAVEAKAGIEAGTYASIGEFFDQGDMFNVTEYTPERALARAIIESRSRKAIREILTGYSRAAEAVDTTTMAMFAEAETTIDDLIIAALEARPIDQVISEVAAELGQNADLPAKLRVIAAGVKKLPLDQRKAMNTAIGAEIERLRDGVVSAPEWQRLNPDFLTPTEALFQRFLDSHNEKTIQEGMRRLLNKETQAVLASSPTVATEFVLFPKESGTLGIPRAKMPQVKGEDRPAFMDFLGNRGVTFTNESIAPNIIKPIQAEYAPTKVERAKGMTIDRRIFISADNYLLDGHHQWLAQMDRPTVNVTRLSLNARPALQAIFAFPKTTTGEGMAVMASSPTVAKAQATFDALVKKYSGHVPDVSEAELFAELAEKFGRENVEEVTKAFEKRKESLEQFKDEFDSIVKRIAQDYNGKPLLAPLKGRKRSVEKTLNDYNGDVMMLGDVIRASIIANTIGDVDSIADDIHREFKVIKFKNRFSPPLPQGYSDMLFQVEIQPGVIAELQVHIPEMIEAKEKAGHYLYELWRTIENDPTKAAERQLYMDQMLEVYSAAAALALARENERATSSSNSAADISASYASFRAVFSDTGRGSNLANKPTGALPGSLATGMSSTSKNLVPEGKSAAFITAKDTKITDETQENSNTILGSSPTAQEDLFSAAFAPEAGRKYGAVKVGRMNALAAYRTLITKRNQGITLTPREEQQLLDAEEALGQKMAFDMQELKGTAKRELLATPPPSTASGPRTLQQSLLLGDETRGQMMLFSSPTAQLDLFGGIEAQITGPRAKQKAVALAQAKAAPEKGKENIAKRVAKLEGLTDLDLFASTAVKALDAKPKQAQGSPYEYDDLFNSGLSGRQQTDSARGTGQGRRNSGLSEKPNRDDRESGGTIPGQTSPGVYEPDLRQDGSDAGSTDGNAAGRGRGPKQGNKRAGRSGGNASAPRGIVRDRPPVGSPERNFKITPDTVLFEGGTITRLRNNIAAIETLRTIEAENRKATQEEKQRLAKYVGWGGIPQVFDEAKFAKVEKGEAETRRTTARNYARYGSQYAKLIADMNSEADEIDAWNNKWGDHYRALKSLLTTAEWESARDSTINAHYTSPTIISKMWDAVKRLGFKGGNVTEPAGGIGHFFGLMPDDLIEKSNLYGVELDSVSARIMTALYPEADIEAGGFQDTTLPENSQDLVISNVPFANINISDEWLDSQPGAPKFNLHNYFFEKSLRMAKPGGIVAFITTAHTMDSQLMQRKWLAERADFIGAIRLPSNAFKENANTDVVTDIIFLRKPDGRPNPVKDSWTGLAPIPVEGSNIQINEYFAAHPEMVLGTFATDGSMYGGKEEMTVHGNGDLAAQLSQAIANLPENVTGDSATVEIERVEKDNRSAKDGAFIMDGGALKVKGGGPVPQGLKARVSAFMELRDTLNELYRMEADPDADTEAMEKQRKRLNLAYDRFKQGFKNLHHRLNRDALQSDPDYYRTLGLELFDEDLKDFRKADVFTKRVLSSVTEPDSAESFEDAVIQSFRWRGSMDVNYMADLLGITAAEVQAQVTASGIGYRNPVTGLVDHKTQYLSGNVRRKLRDAELAVKSDPTYQRNVDDLKAVLPDMVKWSDIGYGLGSAWIPTDVYQTFVESQVIDGRNNAGVQVIYNKGVGEIISDSYVVTKQSHYPSSIDQKWGTNRKTALEILDAALNQRDPRVMDYVKDAAPVFNAEETDKARQAVERMKEAFTAWIAKDDALQDSLHQTYNEAFNSHVLPQYDGSFMQLPWVAKDFDLYPSKKHVVWRAIQDGNMLIAHGVGGGKTIIGTSIAMEMKRLGMAQKPLIVVHNATLEQFAATFSRMAPTARVLVARKEDLEGPKRKEFMGRVRSGDWDAVVMAHSTFDLIPDDPAFEKKQVDDLLAELQDAIDESGEDVSDMRKIKDPSVKELVKMRNRLRERLGKIQDRRTDDVLTFQELGFDMMILDEAHLYKKMPFVTKQTRIAGIDTGTSKKGSALQLRAKWIQQNNKGRGVFTMTGTPVTNTMGESWNMVRLVRPDLLKEFGVQTFDRFISNFGNVVQTAELRANGQYKAVTRLAEFQNIPEWNRFWGLAADVKLGDDMEVKGRPKIKGGKAGITIVEKTPGVASVIEEITNIIDRYDKMTGKEKRENSHVPLLTFAAARMAAIDVRLVRPDAKDETGSKVNSALREVMRLYKETTENKGTQVIFADSYRPLKTTRLDLSAAEFDAGANSDNDAETDEDGGFNLYHDIRAKLIKAGIPASEIAIIKEAKNDKQKEAIFSAVNKGEVRIILGSTETLGTGVNMQERMIAAHHLDVPWTPAGLEQRDGRAYRQGNIWANIGTGEIELRRYGMKNTLDAALWQKLETKDRFIKQAVSGKESARKIEDDTGLLNFAEQKAALAGPDAMAKFQLDDEARRLSNEARAHRERGFDLRQSARAAEETLKRDEAFLPKAAKISASVKPLATVEPVDVVWTFSRDVLKEDGTVLVEAGQKLQGDAFKNALAQEIANRNAKAGTAMTKEMDELSFSAARRNGELPAHFDDIELIANGVTIKAVAATVGEDIANAANPAKRWRIAWRSVFPMDDGAISPTRPEIHAGHFLARFTQGVETRAMAEKNAQSRIENAVKNREMYAEEIARPFAKKARYAEVLIQQAQLYRRMGMGLPEREETYREIIGDDWEKRIVQAPARNARDEYHGRGLAPEAVMMSSPTRSAPVDLPDAIVAHSLGAATSRPEYEEAKAGDPAAALQLARALVTDDVVQSIRNLIGNKNPVIVPVLAIEQTGNNMIPAMVGMAIREKLGLTVSREITQSVKANRSKLSGLDRVFQRAAFAGEVTAGEDYLLVDDTLTQGGTFAALADHIRSNGGNVIGVFALTGRQYSAKLRLSNELLGALREKFGDIEQDFARATGYGFDNLTESEARALAAFRPSDAVRNRILAQANVRSDGLGGEATGNVLGSSPTTATDRITALLAKTPPMYRAVYADLRSGMSPADVAAKNGIPLKGVGNIMRRLESYLGSVTLAAADQLAPAMQGGLIAGGRPDLALSGNPVVAAVDQMREAVGVPEIRAQDAVNAQAAAMLAKDYQGTYDALLASARDGGQMSDTEVAATKLVIAQETMSGKIDSMEDRMKLAMLIHGYREIGTETARALAMRRDPHQSPAERHAQYIAEALFTPDPETRRRMRKNPKGAESMLQSWMTRVDAINGALLAQGIDLKAALAEHQQNKLDQQEAEQLSQGTATVIEQTVKKLNRLERAVIEALRGGALATEAALITGVSVDEVLEINGRFVASVKDAMREAVRKYLAAVLGSSPSNTLDEILAEFNIFDNDMIDDRKPGFKDRRKEKKKTRRPRSKTPAPTTVPATTPTPAPVPTPPAATPPAATPPGAKPKTKQPAQTPAATPPAIDERTGTWDEERDFQGQGELIRPPIDERTGTFDLNDPVSVKAVMDAFAHARGSKMDALMEFWRMSILTGPQTHIVNVGSNTLHAAYHLIPKRGAEALINNLLGVVGLGSNEKATFGEFAPMARNLKKGVALAARNALRSWKLESRVTEAYANATAVQLDFTGMGSEYIPPALGGEFGKIMRSLSFRAMTAADEFMKSLYGQMEAAAQAHRIATAEKLTGAAYSKRIDALMVPGSEAWVRAMDSAKRITFQEDIDGSNPRLIHRIDQLAELAKKGRAMPYLGKPLTFFLPFIDTPTNIFKQAVLMSPLGTFLSIVDGARALRRRVFAGDISKAEAQARAAELYDRARFVEDVTNQAIGWMLFFAIESLVAGDDDDEDLPYITGTVPYKTTARGERDNAYAVMPPQSIRIGDLMFSYSRIEPFATALASMVDFSSSIKRNGFTSVAVSDWLSRFKDAAKDKTFLQGVSNLVNAIEDPDRFAERLTANIVTGFVPNIIRQPVREMDGNIRDATPMADAGFFSSVAQRIGYTLVPQSAPAKMDVWGNEIPANRGEITGLSAADAAIRIFDPLNVQIAPAVDPIDRWIFRWNQQTADTKDRVAVQPIPNKLQGTVPGETKPRNFALTPEEVTEANRNAGQMARAALGDEWEKMPMTQEVAERIKDVVSQAQRIERERIRNQKIQEAMK